MCSLFFSAKTLDGLFFVHELSIKGMAVKLMNSYFIFGLIIYLISHVYFDLLSLKSFKLIFFVKV
jgi:hypothetical protein